MIPTYLQILCETGIFGFLIFLVILFYKIFAIKRENKDSYKMILMSSLIILCCNIFFLSVIHEKIIWSIFILVDIYLVKKQSGERI